jgi:aquaporin Z
MRLAKPVAAGFFGTFWLCGCGSAILAAAFPQLSIHFIGVAFAFGLTVATMAYAMGPIFAAEKPRPLNVEEASAADPVL